MCEANSWFDIRIQHRIKEFDVRKARTSGELIYLGALTRLNSQNDVVQIRTSADAIGHQQGFEGLTKRRCKIDETRSFDTCPSAGWAWEVHPTPSLFELLRLRSRVTA